jgi:hypothetical protein
MSSSHRRELESLARTFKVFVKSPAIENLLIGKASENLLDKVDCEDLYDEDDYGGRSNRRVTRYSGGTHNPHIDVDALYELYEENWTPMLRKVDRKFDALCAKFLEVYMRGHLKSNRKDAEEALEEALAEYFWSEVPEYGDELSEDYDELRAECEDSAAEARDPYGYRGLSRRDFLASPRRVASRYSLKA